MAFSAHPILAVSLVATAPSPATSGATVTVTTGQGARFGSVFSPPVPATIWPAGLLPDPTNAEVVWITGRSGDVLTITRAQEGTSARTVVVGDQIAATATPKTFTDLETQIDMMTRTVVYARGSAAVPDGTYLNFTAGTDNTTLIQAALDLAGTLGGGIVQLEPGVYRTGQLVLPNRVWLRGVGRRATVLQLKNSANAHVIINHLSTNQTSDPNAKTCGVSDLGIHGNADNNTGTIHGIYFSQNPQFGQATSDDYHDAFHHVSNVWIEYCRNDGYKQDAMNESRLWSVYVHNCVGYGINLLFDAFAVSCTADNTGLAGFNCTGTSIRLDNCKAFSCGGVATDKSNGHGFLLGNYQGGVNLTNCEAQDNFGAGFYFNNGRGGIVTGCTADSNSVNVDGAYAGFHFNANATGYQLTGCAAFERQVQAGRSPQANAVYFGSGCTGNAIKGMSFFGSDGGGFGIGAIADPIKLGSVLEGNSIEINGIGSAQVITTPVTPTTAPTLALATSPANGLGSRTRYVTYAWRYAGMETVQSSEANLATLTGTTLLKVTPPAFPAGVDSAVIYVGAATGQTKRQVGYVTVSGGSWCEPFLGYDANGIPVNAAATFRPDPYAYSTALLTLTGAQAVRAPLYQHKCALLRLAFAQDATGGRVVTFDTTAAGTATSGAAGTLTNTGASFGTTQFIDDYVLIVSGTGAGQRRRIISHTNTVLTIAPNWTTNPDSTSVYTILGYSQTWAQNFQAGRKTILETVFDGNAWAQTNSPPTLVKTITSVVGGDTIASTAAATNFADNYPVQANLFVVGRTIRISAYGTYSTLGSGTVTLRLRLLLGTTQLLDSTVITTAISIAARQWRLEGQLVCTAVGASGVVEALGEAKIPTANTNVGVAVVGIPGGAVTIDTTATANLQIEATHGASNASNTITMRQFVVEVLDQ